MKAKHVFTTLGLALVMSLGVGAGLLHQYEFKQAKADETTTLYCKMTYDWWKADGAAIGVHYWGGSSSTDWPGVRGTAVQTDVDVWKFEIPSNSTGFVFLRINGGTGAVEDWGAKTADLSFEVGMNLYTITSSSAVWGNPGVAGSWSAYVEPAEVTKYSVDVYVDGVKRGTEQIIEGALPSPELTVYGKGFDGWYSIAACTGDKVTGITSNTSVYGTTFNLPQWSYTLDTFMVSTTFTNKYLYAFESNDRHNAAWPGEEIDGNTIIVPNDAKIVINNGGPAQTEDITQSCVANDILRILNDRDGSDHYRTAWRSSLDEPYNEGYYICGEFSSNPCWTYDDAERMTDTTGENVAYELNFLLAVGDELRVRSFYTDRTPYDQWATLGDNGYADPTTGWGEKHGDNFRATKAGYYDIYAKYINDEFMFFVAEHYVEPVYTLKVANGEALSLVPNEGTEYKLIGVDLTAKQKITVYADGVEIPDMQAKLVRNNNLDSFCKVLVNTNAADIYVDVSAKTIWVSGMPTGGYHILKNGTTLVQMTHTDAYDGFNQYCSELLTFAQNDTIEFIDAERTGNENTLPVVFHINTINAGGLGDHFEIVDGIMKCKTACSASVYMKLKSGLDEVYFGAVEQYITDAEAFAEGFNSAIGGVCKEDGTTNRSSLETAWAAQSEAFTALTAEAKAEVKKGSLSTVQAIRDCAEKYESVYRLRKLGSGWNLDNFLELTISSNRIGLAVNNNNYIILVAVISTCAIIASAGITLYFLRKKKYSK